MVSRFRHVVPVAIVSVIALCFLAGCEECPEGAPPPPPSEGNSMLWGYVLDAISGEGVSGADVSGGGASDVSEEDGYYALSGLDAGDVTVDITADGYIDFESEIAIAASETLQQDFTIVPLSEFDDWRIVLSWGENPEDLDSHLWVPTGAEEYTPVDWVDDGYLDELPYAQLDVDDQESYGPETITIRKHPIESRSEDFYADEYVYAVHHWYGLSDIPNSGAQVRIYRGNVLVRTITAPAGTAYEEWYWYVGRLNCRTGALTLVNEYRQTSPLPWAWGRHKK